MGTFVHDCAPCGTRRAAFSVLAHVKSTLHLRRYSTVGQCNVCEMPSIATWDHTGTGLFEPEHVGGDLFKRADVVVRQFLPRAEEVDVPDGVPDGVARAFREASQSRRDRRPMAACSMYRRAMEQALKAFSPDVEAWKLEKRIDKLAALHLITPELRSWAHELRLDGNEALHGDGEPTMEITDQMHELCKFLLIYLYSLPLQVAAASKRRKDAAEG